MPDMLIIELAMEAGVAVVETSAMVVTVVAVVVVGDVP
jgi:hypothetical protein